MWKENASGPKKTREGKITFIVRKKCQGQWKTHTSCSFSLENKKKFSFLQVFEDKSRTCIDSPSFALFSDIKWKPRYFWGKKKTMVTHFLGKKLKCIVHSCFASNFFFYLLQACRNRNIVGWRMGFSCLTTPPSISTRSSPSGGTTPATTSATPRTRWAPSSPRRSRSSLHVSFSEYHELRVNRNWSCTFYTVKFSPNFGFFFKFKF